VARRMTCDTAIDQHAARLAGFAFRETDGNDHQKVQAALWAYEWAKANIQPWGKPELGMRAYPSLTDLRAAMTPMFG
jgi:hypothetical protein